ncbi:hypothetical protein B296_00047765, partial [Ensete ventricosum]
KLCCPRQGTGSCDRPVTFDGEPRVTSGVKISVLKLSCAPDVRSRSETVSKNQGAVPYAGWRPAEPNRR